MSFVYDPSQPDFHSRIDAIYRELRDQYPVYHNESWGIWAISRYDDVREAYARPEKLSNVGSSMSMGAGADLPLILETDPPYHDQLRALVSRVFTPRRVQTLEPRMREIARELIDGFAEKGECELITEFARIYPNRVISELIGIPRDLQHTLLDWSEGIISVPAVGAAEHFEKITTPMLEVFEQLLRERSARRQDDLMSALIDSRLDERSLSEKELLGLCYMLVTGGSDTTQNLIGNAAVLLAQHPDQRRTIAREPARISGMVEEALRFESPAQTNNRVAVSDYPLHGVTIPRGAEVRLVLGAANRDERRIPDPDRFDALRRPVRHLGLGEGVHFCLGASLARAETRIAFEELLERIPEYELTEEPEWLPSVWTRAHPRVRLAFPR